MFFFFFFSSRRRHTRSLRDWSSDVCSSDLGLARLLPVTHGPVDDAFLFPGDVGVAQERGEIVGDRAVDRVLKIENARARLAYHEVARVIIAVHENARLPEVVREERRKSLLQGLALRGAELSLELAGDVPIGKKAQFPLE